MSQAAPRRSWVFKLVAWAPFVLLGTGLAWLGLRDTDPGAREGHGLAADPTRGVLVLFGGQSGHDGTFPPFDDTWEWSGGRWRRVRPIASPAARAGHALCQDVTPGRVVLVGGADHTSSSRPAPPFKDTWSFDGSTWIEMKGAPSPGGRDGAAMAFDSDRQRVVLYGGATTQDTWEWDGAGWREIKADPAPPARAWHAMAYDAARKKVVLYGGMSQNGPLDDTWLWDGRTWSLAAPAKSPPAGGGCAMAYLPERLTSVLVGGGVGDGPIGVWEWNGTAWTEIKVKPAPPARTALGLAVDPVKHRAVLSAGRHMLGDSMWAKLQWQDTWTFDGAAWQLIGAPPEQGGKVYAP